MDFYNQLLAQKLSGGGGGDKYAAFKSLVDGSIIEITADMLKGVTSIRNHAFHYCKSLTSIEIPNTVTSIGEYAFYGCSKLQNVTIPSSVTSIGVGGFYQCLSFTSVTIPSSITRINDSTFGGCWELQNVTIPSSVTRIGVAFNQCSRLKSVTVESETPPALDDDVFSWASKSLVIYVPAESVDAYKSASNWSTYAARIQAIPSD